MMIRHSSQLLRTGLNRSSRIVSRQPNHVQIVALSSWQQTLGQKFEEAKPMLSQGTLWASGGVMMFGLTKGAYNIFTGFMSMTPYDMGYYGFIAGFCTAGLMGTTGLIARRAIQLYPNELFSKSLHIISNDRNLCEKLGGQLGDHIESQGLKAYKVVGGTVSVVDRSLQWVPPRCSMIFDVKGEMYDALASVEGVQVKGGLEITYISVEVMNSASDRILVRGDETKLRMKDELRQLLNFKSTHTKK